MSNSLVAFRKALDSKDLVMLDYIIDKQPPTQLNYPIPKNLSFIHLIFDSVKLGYLKAVKYLLKETFLRYGYDWFEMAIELAMKKNHLEILKYLLSKSESFQLYSQTDIELSVAIKLGRFERVKYLCETGKHQNQSCDPLLILASKNGQLEIVKYLLERGANPYMQDDHPILRACESGNLELVKFFISLHLKLIGKDYSCIEMACRKGHLQLLKYLISLEDRSYIQTQLPYLLFSSESENQLEICKFIIDTFEVDYRFQVPLFERYMAFCKKMKEKRRHQAAKKIYFWWIPICYSLDNEIGKRMAKLNWQRTVELMDEMNG